MPMSPLLSLIASRRADLTPQQGRIADYVAGHPVQTATMGIEELAFAAGVSVATVNRFARGLGLDGFAAFRLLAVAGFRRIMSPVEKLEAQADRLGDDGFVVAASLEAAGANLREAGASLDLATWVRAAEAVAEARRVYFLGFGLSAALVDLFADMIGPFCRASVVLDGHGGQERILRRTLDVGPEDVVIAVTLPRYSRATLDHAAALRAQGATVIGFTDARAAPLAALADLVLVASAQHPLLHASPTAVVGLFEAFAALLTARRRSTAAEAELSRRISPHLWVEDIEAFGPGAAPDSTRFRE